MLLETGKGILLVLESTVGFVGDGISSLAIGSIQVGQLLGGGIATGINNLRGVKSPDWIGKDWSGTVKNVQGLTPETIFEMSKAAIGSMVDDFKRGDIYDITTDVLTVGTMLTAVNGLKNTAKNVTTKLKTPKVGSLADDVAKKKGVGNPVETAGKGNTGRTIPNYLDEQMAMHEVQSNPLKNAKELPIKMTDPRWPAEDGWVKMQKNIKLSNGKTVSVHYVYNKITGIFDDFKFK